MCLLIQCDCRIIKNAHKRGHKRLLAAVRALQEMPEAQSPSSSE